MAKMNKRDIEKQLQSKRDIPLGVPENTPSVEPTVEKPIPFVSPEPPKVEAPKPVVVPEPAKIELPKVETPKPVVLVTPKTVAPEVQKQVVPKLPVVTPSKFEKKYFDSMSCNYNYKGDWQKQYAKWLQNWFNIAGKKVLDLGCAMGAISSAMADIGAKVVGVDVSLHAKNVSQFRNYEHVIADISDMNMVAEKSVDRVHAMSVFECLEHPKFMNVLKEIKRVLAVSGLAFIVAADHDIKKIADLVKDAGLENVTEKHLPKMREHFDGHDLLGKYQWAVIVLERK